MADCDATEKAESSRKRHVATGNGTANGRAAKKLRATKAPRKVSRKRAWHEMVETDMDMKDAQDLQGNRRTGRLGGSRDELAKDSPLRKVLRTVSSKEGDGEARMREESELHCNGDAVPVGSLQPEALEESQSNVGKAGEMLESQWKKMPADGDGDLGREGGGSQAMNSRGGEANSAANGNSDASEEEAATGPGLEKEEVRKPTKPWRHEALRKGLQTVKLEENAMETGIAKETGRESQADDTVASAATETENRGNPLHGNPQEKKRKGSTRRGESPKHPEKRIRVEAADASAFETLRKEGAAKRTWKRLARENPQTQSASEDMGVLVSDAWKRLRDEKGTDTLGSSVNAQSDSDLSMGSGDSVDELVRRNSKKARYEPPIAFQEKKWRRRNRARREESSTSKRLREESVSESSSGSSGSDAAQSYLHNRMWKRPRFENLMSVQGRAWKRQTRDAAGVTEETSRKRSQVDTSERSRKRQRK